MNLLPENDIIELVRCFSQGRGVRETERKLGVHRDTVMRYFRIFRSERDGEAVDTEKFIVVHALSCLAIPSAVKLLHRHPNKAPRQLKRLMARRQPVEFKAERMR